MEKNVRLYSIHCIIALIIMLSFSYLPTPEPITSMGMHIIGVFFGAIYAWCTVGKIWSSIFALVGLGLSGYCTVPTAFSLAAGNQTVLMVLFLMIFAAIIEQAGLSQRIAIWMISRPFNQGRPWLLSTMILFAAWFLGMFAGLIPSILICWSIVYGIADAVELKPGAKWVAVILCGIVFMAATGCISVPFQIGVVANYGFMTAATNGAYTYSYGAYLIFGVTMALAILFAYVLVCRFIFKPDIQSLKMYHVSQTSEPLNGLQKKAAFIFVLMLIVLMLPCILPAGNGLKLFLEGTLGTTACVAVVDGIAVMMLHEKKAFINFSEMVFKGVSWDIIFMLAAAFTLANAVTSEGTGVSTFIINLLTPIIGGKGTFAFIGLCLIITVVLTNLINNIVVSAIMIPVGVKVGMTFGIDPVVLTTLFICVVDLGFLLPSSSPSGAMLHGNPKWLSKRDIYLYTSSSILLMLFISMFIGYPLASLLF